MRRGLIRQCVPHELVAEAILTVARNEHAGGQCHVEPSRQFVVGAAPDGDDRCKVERAGDERESSEQGDDVVVEVEEATIDRIGKRRSQLTPDVTCPAQLRREECVAVQCGGE